MKLNKICKTCEFGSEGLCTISNNYKEDIGCDEWGASLEYYAEIIDNVPWYIRELYKKYKIDYNKFLELIEKDENGQGIQINIYDAIENVYELTPWELAGVLDVSIGVIGYARNRGTTVERKRQFSSRLHIPESFFDSFLSTQLNALKECKADFVAFYGNKMINKLKQNGTIAKESKFRSDIYKFGYKQGGDR